MLRREVLLHHRLIHVILLLLQLRHVIAKVPRLHIPHATHRSLQRRQLLHLLLATRRQLLPQVRQELLHVLRLRRHLRLQLVRREVRVAQQYRCLLAKLDRLLQESQILGAPTTVECGLDDAARVLHVAVVQNGNHVGVLHRDDVIFAFTTEAIHCRFGNTLQIRLLEVQLGLFLCKILGKLILLLDDGVHQLLVFLSLLLREVRSLTTRHEKENRKVTASPPVCRKCTSLHQDRTFRFGSYGPLFLTPILIDSTVKRGQSLIQVILNQVRHTTLTDGSHRFRARIANLLHRRHITQSEDSTNYV